MDDIKAENLRIITYPPKYPKSVHLYITNECNLDCEKCHYRTPRDAKKELTFPQIKHLFNEWKPYNFTSIAIGGGEPLLHPDITDIIQQGKDMGYYMAVTTNGTVLKPIRPDRIHISYDGIHPTWKNENLIQKAVNHYKSLGCKVGINHIVRSLEGIDYVTNAFENVDNVLLIREKPYSNFTQWNDIKRLQKYWIEGCIEGSRCEQGILSFHVDYNMNASICSNFEKKVKYSTLENTWKKLKEFKCEIRDSNLPKIF